MSVRCSINRTTGFTPFELATGRQFPGPWAPLYGGDTDSPQMYHDKVCAVINMFSPQKNWPTESETARPAENTTLWVRLKQHKRKWSSPRWSEPLRVTARTSHCVQLAGKGTTWYHLSACMFCPSPDRTLADVRVDLRRGQREGEGEGDTEEPEREGEGGERSGQIETAPAPRTQLSATPVFKILQRTGDLLQTPEHIPIAHCISADYALGAGVAKQIRDKYGVEELNTSVAQPGDCIKTTHGPRQIYHLVTKWWCRDLPTYEHLEASLIKLCYQCKKDQNKILAIPKLGCGLDKLDYIKVKEIIEKVFKEGHIQIILLTK
ncbi:uncharacterized protein LOC130215693 [Danio aesculapii]|uniref:uncharacterized protein LOC130215693 n=1 Tax=Danio aesculapii TaxID=1142201 RepID=UPI0024C0D2A6|nr:uncharacterized protein LOC130215693 [Danio aesculapii]